MAAKKTPFEIYKANLSTGDLKRVGDITATSKIAALKEFKQSYKYRPGRYIVLSWKERTKATFITK